MPALSILLVTALLVLAPPAAHGQAGLPAAVLHYPELVLLNGKVVTVDDRFSISEAIAIRDGTVLALGTSLESRALGGPGTPEFELRAVTERPAPVDWDTHMLR